MKALLTSSFRYMGNFFLPSLDFNRKDLTCLFVRYALQDEGHINMCKQVLKNCLPIKKMIDFVKESNKSWVNSILNFTFSQSKEENLN